MRSMKNKDTFKDIRGTLTDEQVKKDTERCISCGATVVDEYSTLFSSFSISK